MELYFFAAFGIGLLGSTHCLGMCGGIVGLLNKGVPEAPKAKKPGRPAFHIAYNTGRIASYTIAGAIVGGISSLLSEQASRMALEMALPIGGIIAGLVLVALGLYLAGVSQAITWLERAGQVLWRFIEPVGKRLLPVQTLADAFGVGLIWGWLPCGLVYAALAMALVSGSPGEGAWLMFGFGLGTLPMLLAMGSAIERLRRLVRNPAVRRISGAAIVALGLYTAVASATGHYHSGHPHNDMPDLSSPEP